MDYAAVARFAHASNHALARAGTDNRARALIELAYPDWMNFLRDASREIVATMPHLQNLDVRGIPEVELYGCIIRPKADTIPKPSIVDMAEVEQLAFEIRAELHRARSRFPASDNLTTIAMFEEAGEVAKAVLSEDPAAVRKECVQLAVMAMRIVLDGDPSTTAYRSKHHGLPPLVRRPEFEE